MRSVRRRAALPLTLLLLAGAACSSGDTSSDTATPDAPAATAPAATGPPTTAAVPGAVLDDPGGQPRQPLALKVTAGTRVKVATVNKVGVKLTIDGTAAPEQPAPATRLVVDERVDSVDPDGTVHFSVNFAEASAVPTAGVDPATVRAVQGALDELKKIRGTGTVTALGDAKELTLDTSAVTDPVLKSLTESASSQVGNLSTPFPKDPVGVGARWTVTRRATLNGLVLDTTTHYTLRSRTGDRYELDLTQDAASPPGRANLQNLPPGGQATVDSFSLQSRGQLTGDLTRPLPLRSTLTGTGDGSFTVTAGGNRTTLRQQMTLETTTSDA